MIKRWWAFTYYLYKVCSILIDKKYIKDYQQLKAIKWNVPTVLSEDFLTISTKKMISENVVTALKDKPLYAMREQ